jgi:benzodiazapine receptor
MRKSSFWALAGFGGLCALTALVGGRVTRRNMSWYDKLDKPSFQPPRWLFGPVWTTLYGLMSLSALRVWRTPPSPARRRALGLWGGQLAANAAWSPLFFGAHRPRAALADMAAMGAGVAGYVNEARKVDSLAAWMMAPYLAWLGVAGALNTAIIRKNPRLHG